MNISRAEQRVLHALARGGFIAVEKDDKAKIIDAQCYTREGWVLTDCTLGVFSRLKRRRLISSRNSGPYRITYLGRQVVRPQLDNRA